MFVAIKSPKAPLQTQNLFHKCWRGHDEITPEICMEVLRSTNFKTCILRMLESIDKLPPNKQSAFKEVILSTFHNREQPHDVSDLGQKLAANNNFLPEFAEIATTIYNKTDNYIISSPKAENTLALHDISYFRSTAFEGHNSVIFTAEQVNVLHSGSFPPFVMFKNNAWAEVDYCYLDGIEQLKFDGLTRASVRQNKTSPKNIEFFNCHTADLTVCALKKTQYLKFNHITEIEMSFVKDFGGKLLINHCDTVDMSDSIFSELEDPKFNDVKNLKAKNCSGFKGTLDFNGIQNINLQASNLDGVESLKVTDNKTLSLNFAQNLPQHVELTNCEDANFEDAKFKSLEHFSATNVNHLRLQGNRTLSGTITLTNCNEVTLRMVDFKNVQHISFNNIKKLDLSYKENLPAELDFSKCGEVKLDGLALEFSTPKTITFASRAQYKNSGLSLINEAKCTLKFAEDEIPTLNRTKDRER